MPYLLRVDDCGWRPQDKSDDAGLEYFQKWRTAFGIAGHRVFYGFIPTTLGTREIKWLKANLTPEEEMAVHGWDHARGAIVTTDLMQQALDRFLPLRTRAYIPPFNVYTVGTIWDWVAVCRKSIFFGGFDDQDDRHHKSGHLPGLIVNTYHVPAIRPLYDRAGPILDRIADYDDLQCPLTVTLHATWDVDNLAALRPLKEHLAGKLIGYDELETWMHRTELDRKKLTAPHYLAYRWILEGLPLGQRVLDFGSRYSVLPSQMALRGNHVTASDRDASVITHQGKIAKEQGARLRAIAIWDAMTPKFVEDFDVITACWAIQHNTEEGAIETVVRNLVRALKPGSQLRIVSSFTTGESFLQTDRKDPQWVLNQDDHVKRIIEPSACRVVDTTYFRYVHGTDEGNFCEVTENPNAICYRLLKGR